MRKVVLILAAAVVLTGIGCGWAKTPDAPEDTPTPASTTTNK